MTREPWENGSGPLKTPVLAIYVYYDRPLVFLAGQAPDALFLWMLADDTPDRWWVLPVSPARLAALQTRQMTLRAAVQSPETGWLYAVQDDPVPTVTVVDHVPEPEWPGPASWLTPEHRVGKRNFARTSKVF